jgi:hypothetical protein
VTRQRRLWWLLLVVIAYREDGTPSDAATIAL